MVQDTIVKASENVKRRLVLPLVILGTSVALVYLWWVLFYYPSLHCCMYCCPGDHWAVVRYFWGSEQEVWTAFLFPALVTILMGMVAFFLVVIATKRQETSVRFARACALLLVLLLFLTLALMVIPFIQAGWKLTGYNGPELYAPFTWGALGNFAYEFTLHPWNGWGFHIIIVTLAIIISILTTKPDAFGKLQRRLYVGVAIGSAVYVLGFLAIYWPSIAYWLFD